MIKTSGVYHTGIPVDDINRAERFYTEVLGMQLVARVGQEGAQLSRLNCGAVSFGSQANWRTLPRGRCDFCGFSFNWGRYSDRTRVEFTFVG